MSIWILGSMAFINSINAQDKTNNNNNNNDDDNDDSGHDMTGENINLLKKITHFSIVRRINQLRYEIDHNLQLVNLLENHVHYV